MLYWQVSTAARGCGFLSVVWYRVLVMKTAQLVYDLPETLIAQYPCERRDESRLLVVDRGAGEFKEDVFKNLCSYLDAGDCLVLNDTRVIRARLHGRKKTGGKVEIFLLRELKPGLWEALIRPSARVKAGMTVYIGDSICAEVENEAEGGRRRVRFSEPDVLGVLEASGEIPLPPYIRRRETDDRDSQRYQTIYARHPGAVAAPTAGLHFTSEVFAALEAQRVQCANLTLHVGYGTFKPVQTERLEDHQVEAEDFVFSENTAKVLNETRAAGGRVAAVGTTTTRVLESQYYDGSYWPGSGVTKLCIYPPYRFRGIDVLLTNFHLPRSSLLALVCAFAGTDFVLDAYRHAVDQKFNFYSYGDAMLIL